MMVVVMTMIMRTNGEDGHPPPESTTKEKCPKMKMMTMTIMMVVIIRMIMRTNGDDGHPRPVSTAGEKMKKVMVMIMMMVVLMK